MDIDLTKLEAELSKAYADFIRVTTQLGPGKFYQPGVSGDWSPKDVVSHLIGWDTALQEFITDPDGFNPNPLYDVDMFNAKSVSERQHQSWEETVDELQSSYKDLQKAISGVAREMKIYDRVKGWMKGRKADYELHTMQIEEWIAQNGGGAKEGTGQIIE
ncbi:MAG: ClbS/DfsB family four-helix bundle protein [Chloroflexales bacterium]|nr:ClbS/DfsB family four-helix bundle protein [Chloroflexales bacterium]